jgi:hypothetical protein
MEGMLHKKATRFSWIWRRRYVRVVGNSRLRWYTAGLLNGSGVELQGEGLIASVVDVPGDRGAGKRQHRFDVCLVGGVVVQLAGETAMTKQHWVSALKTLVQVLRNGGVGGGRGAMGQPRGTRGGGGGMASAGGSATLITQKRTTTKQLMLQRSDSFIGGEKGADDDAAAAAAAAAAADGAAATRAGGASATPATAADGNSHSGGGGGGGGGGGAPATPKKSLADALAEELLGASPFRSPSSRKSAAALAALRSPPTQGK